ncbi:MAG TPA: DUF1800 domain-containing protein [Casimicrobiaceae bacterium]|nr:DUF1800 domain-containing protein [Casimicrobiaceae bacterium]
MTLVGVRKVTAQVSACAVFFASAIASATPSALGEEDARHLLARTGFGPTAREVAAFATLTREQAIERLLADLSRDPMTPVPESLRASGPIRLPGPDASEEERRAFRQQQLSEGLELRGWWIEEMLATHSPLTERMTLFWHSHFASSQQKVRFARLMYQQNATFRRHALGNFRELLFAAAREPAMIVYLDVAQNRRGAPNENFAREVMELFTLGEGRYREEDVREAARAFTGWSIDRDTGTFRMRPLLHDAGVKSVLGTTGRLDGDAVLAILLAQPATAEHIVAKLWREFVSPAPEAREVQRIAERFRRADYSISVALRELLLSDAFYDPANRGALVKSPVELVVGTLRQLDVKPASGAPFAIAAATMGQNLFAPPNVKGWVGGEAWINASTLLARKAFVERFVASDAPLALMTSEIRTGEVAEMTGNEAMAAVSKASADEGVGPNRRFARMIERGIRDMRFDAAAWLQALPGASDDARRAHAQALLLPATGPFDSRPIAPSQFIRTVFLDPSYQLK